MIPGEIKKGVTLNKTEQLIAETGIALGDLFKGMGFALLVFDFHEPGISNYVSNASRKDMILALRETADRLETFQDIPKTQGEC